MQLFSHGPSGSFLLVFLRGLTGRNAEAGLFGATAWLSVQADDPERRNRLGYNRAGGKLPDVFSSTLIASFDLLLQVLAVLPSTLKEKRCSLRQSPSKDLPNVSSRALILLIATLGATEALSLSI